jgi:hypothetical protein
MNRGMKQTLAVAVLTGTVATIGMHSVLPSADSTTSSGRQHELQSQYSEVQKREERERRRLLKLHADTRITDSLRSAEVRKAERRVAELEARKAALRSAQKALAKSAGDDAARAAARRLLERAP